MKGGQHKQTDKQTEEEDKSRTVTHLRQVSSFQRKK